MQNDLKEIENMIESVIELRNLIVGMPASYDVISKMYQRTYLKDNFVSDSLMGGYMSHEYSEKFAFPVKKKYI